MKIILSLLILISVPAFSNCTYLIDGPSVQIGWTAFKTPKKVGVNGKFDKFTLSSADSTSIEKAIEMAQFEIDAKSVNTTNPDRDKKIVNFFFTKNSQPLKISGKVNSFKEGVTTMNLSINGIKKDVPLDTKIEGEKVTMSGVIDVFDFSLNKQLSAINKACLALHENKTWNDVGINLTASFIKKCQ